MCVGQRMLGHMRTTINLPDQLAAAAKARAAAESRTFTSLVEEALRTLLSQQPQDEDDAPLPTYGSPGGRILIDLDDRDAVWAALDSSADG